MENEIHEKKCLDCGNIFIPDHNRVPLKGKFGINVMLLVTQPTSTFLQNRERNMLKKKEQTISSDRIS